MAEGDMVQVSREEWEALQARLERLERLADRDERGGASTSGPAEVLTDRRGLLKRGAVLAAGTAAGVAAFGAGLAQPADAADGDNLTLGATNTSARPTIVECQYPYPATAVAITDEPGYAPSLPALGDRHVPLLTVQAAQGQDFGIYAAGSYGIAATGNEYGVVTMGDVASMRLEPTLTAGPPTADTQAHQLGELTALYPPGGVVTSPVALWFCTESGTPGSWSLVAAKDSSATFTAWNYRMYDSRDGDGPLRSGQTRTINAPGFDDLGSTNTALLINLTLADTVGSGYLQVFGHGLTVPHTSTINWYTNGQIVANMTVFQPGDSGQIDIRASGGGSSDFIVDLLGWYA